MLWPFRLLLVAALCAAFLGSRAAATPGEVLYVQAGEAALRQAPGPTAGVVRSLARGRKLLEFERRAGWIRVMLFGAVAVEGWIEASQVAGEPPGRNAAAEAAAPAAEPPAARARRPSFVLDVAGTPARSFRVACRVLEADGRLAAFKAADLIPKSYAFAAEAVACTVEKTELQGRLEVTLRRDGRRIAFGKTFAAFNWVRVRSRGPWGEAAAVRGRVGLLITPPAPGAQGRSGLVPPLRSPTPPPGSPVPALAAPRPAD